MLISPGKMIASGRLAKLEGELALQKNLTEEMKKNQLEMDEFMAELDEVILSKCSTHLYPMDIFRMWRGCSRQFITYSNSFGRLKRQLQGRTKITEQIFTFRPI